MLVAAESRGGKGNIVRETCAFHAAKISCETLVDYWSGLNDESRQSLLQMEEEDFVAKLTYRSKDKSFCPHCRKNFKLKLNEVKELKRVHKEPSYTSKDDKLAERNEKDLDKDGPHPEKHAKDPEDARGFLLSIATVVFKQKGALCHILTCTLISIYYKHNQLLEEEDREKREEEVRSEKKTKQREKKLRQKNQIRGKENINVEAEKLLAVDDLSGTNTLSGTQTYVAHLGDPAGKAAEDVPISPAMSEEPLRNISMGQEKFQITLNSPLHGTNVNLGTTDDHGFIMIEKSVF